MKFWSFCGFSDTHRVGLKLSVCGRPCVMYANLDGHNPNSSSRVSCPYSLPGHSLDTVTSRDRQLMVTLEWHFHLGLGLFLVERLNLSSDLTASLYLWKLSKPKKEQKEKTYKEPTFFGFVCRGDILGGVWILHLGVLFLFSLHSNNSLSKLTRRTNWFTFFIS